MTTSVAEQVKKSQEYKLTYGSKFKTITNTAIRTFTVDSIGVPQEETSVVFSLEQKNDTFLMPYDVETSRIIIETKKILAKIVDIHDNTVIAELYLDNCETQKELKKYYIDILKKQGLLKVGTEFFFVYKQFENGLQVCVERYSNNNFTIKSSYEQMCNDLGL